MHNRAGAISETRHVFAEAIDRAFEGKTAARFATVGLGLGYLDFWIAAQSIREQRAVHVRSFESNAPLSNAFACWLSEEPVAGVLSDALEGALAQVALQWDVDPGVIKQRIRKGKAEGTWIFDGALTAKTSWPERVDAILYDVFSASTSAALWTTNFFESFLSRAAHSRCVFATYASLGVLKRTLTNEGFKLIPRKGFATKRESTLAIRKMA